MDRTEDSDDGAFTYTGSSNLEAMVEAKRYNAFLVDLVVDGMRGREELLDFGAGIGTFAQALLARGVHVEAVEPDDAQRRQLESLGIVAFRSIGDVGDGVFSGVYTLNVLEHIEDDAAVLKELHRVLRPHGRLLIYVPALPLLFTAMDVRVGHVRRYRRRELLDRVESAGFAVLDTRYVDCVGVIATLAYRFVGSRDGRLDPRSVALYDRLVFPISRRLDRLFQRVAGKNLLVLAAATK